jgi:hypothetical protein
MDLPHNQFRGTGPLMFASGDFLICLDKIRQIIHAHKNVANTLSMVGGSKCIYVIDIWEPIYELLLPIRQEAENEHLQWRRRIKVLQHTDLCGLSCRKCCAFNCDSLKIPTAEDGLEV